ncbi:MAG TPA: AAA family ATPase [Planctomycetaceae bacterium]|nr:AAA family ATPase [Planctomycetaceae bacterium]
MTVAELSAERERELISELRRFRGRIDSELSRVIIGQKQVVQQLLISLLSGGNCLLTGAPGLAKTLLVKTIAQLFDLQFNRIQFTPDLMPADITGTEVLEEDSSGARTMRFIPGPIFANVLLADEINRTPPKTQAALLEAMQEHKVTVGGTTYTLEEPFFVLATQNPIEQEGTYPLPEAQRDRFLFNVIVDYPTRDEEARIIDRTTSTQSATPAPVVSGPEIIACQDTVRLVPLPAHVRNFVLDLVRSARPKDPASAAWVREQIDWGPGPRASQQLVLAAKARALLKGRYHVTLEDVETLALPVLRHRIVPTFSAEAEGVSVDDLIRRLLREVPRPDRKLL